MSEPLALADLLRDPNVGLEGGFFRALMLSPAQTTCECFWRVLECCHLKRPRPAFVIFLDDSLGPLEAVVSKAAESPYLVKSHIVRTLPGQPPPAADVDPE